MTAAGKDALRDALALLAADLTGDTEGQQVIRENADPADLVSGLLMCVRFSVHLLAQHDGADTASVVQRLQKTLRTL